MVAEDCRHRRLVRPRPRLAPAQVPPHRSRRHHRRRRRGAGSVSRPAFPVRPRRFGQLRDVPVDGVPPALRAADGQEPGDGLRDDAVVDFAGREAMLEAAPRREQAYVYVPKIMGEAEG